MGATGVLGWRGRLGEDVLELGPDGLAGDEGLVDHA